MPNASGPAGGGKTFSASWPVSPDSVTLEDSGTSSIVAWMAAPPTMLSSSRPVMVMVTSRSTNAPSLSVTRIVKTCRRDSVEVELPRSWSTSLSWMLKFQRIWPRPLSSWFSTEAVSLPKLKSSLLRTVTVTSSLLSMSVMKKVPVEVNIASLPTKAPAGNSVTPPVKAPFWITGSSFVPVIVIVTCCSSNPPSSSVTRTVKVSVTVSPALSVCTTPSTPSVPLASV